MTGKVKFSLTVKYVLLALCATMVLLPIIYTVTNSFMDANEINSYYSGIYDEDSRTVFHLFPDDISLNGYYQMLLRRPDYLVKFWNSLGYTTLMVVGQAFISCLAGYAFAKFRFPGREALFFIVIIIMMMPYQVTLVSNYIVLDKMGLIGGWPAVMLPAVFSPFGVFVLRQSIAAIPQEIIEAAKIDGANQARILFQIVMPRCKGGIVAVLILGFIDNWNMVEQPLIFLSERNQYPLSIFLSQINSSSPELGFACGVLAMIPVVLLFLFFENELVEGITISTVK